MPSTRTTLIVPIPFSCKSKTEVEKKVTLSVLTGRSGLLGLLSSEIETPSAPFPSPVNLLQTQLFFFFSAPCPTSKRYVF